MNEWDGGPCRWPAVAGSTSDGVGLDWSVAPANETDAAREPSFVPRGGVGDLLGWTPRELAVVSALDLVHPDERHTLEGLVVGGGAGVVAFVPVEMRMMARATAAIGGLVGISPPGPTERRVWSEGV